MWGIVKGRGDSGSGEKNVEYEGWSKNEDGVGES